MILTWEEKVTSDDHGTLAKPSIIETVWVAYDAQGHEWIVSKHDDGQSWNWFRCNEDGDVLGGETDHKTPESARAGAEARAARMPG